MFFVLCCLLKICWKSAESFNKCYSDSGTRLDKTSQFLTPKANVYTTSFSVEELDKFVMVLHKYVKPGDVTLYFQSLPTLHYLTDTQPYLQNPWPWTYGADVMKKQFEKAKVLHSKIPVVVREKSSVQSWIVFYENWNNCHAEEDYIHSNKKIELIDTFLKANNYKVVWEDNLFQILKPVIDN